MEFTVSFKTMLVLLDESEDSSVRLDTACSMAEHHGAHMTALALSLHAASYMAAGIDGGAAAAAIDAGLMEESRKQAQSIATAGQKSIDARGVLGDARWASHERFGLREAVALQGRHSDLVIAGQPLENLSLGLREAALEGALFSSGRPVLVAPANWQGPVKMRRVVVAWDGSKEAARAIGDAAPIIERAEKVVVVVVDPEPDYQGLGEDPGADIATVLARHCSNVELDRVPSSGVSIAQAVLNRTTDAAGDLIVMGGYSHSPLRESVFGGATREIIRQTTIPLFMSH
jgi:nucleotide-binding universal stress UspA family protein